jgi:cytochrome c peroxidase
MTTGCLTECCSQSPNLTQQCTTPCPPVLASDRSRESLGLLAAIIGLPLIIAALLGLSYVAHASLPPVPVPVENPITEAKRVLGKVLFWDEQLSNSNTVACGTCHQPQVAGTDPRIATNPGRDGVIGTPDDVIGSPGVIASTVTNDYRRVAGFGVSPQVTGRTANSMINAAYAPELFWDGRASSQFTDPETGQVLIPAGGALESQAIGPPLNTVEMAHAGMNWDRMAQKLQRVRPLELAASWPADVALALADRPSYPELFRRAFGDPQITASRIAFAIATYQRTLIADQTPFDAFLAGQGTLSPAQSRGLQAFTTTARCNECHTLPMGTDHSFRNIGLRPIIEDNGRQGVTGNPADAGKFKVPSLRNVVLKPNFMHIGQFQTLPQVMGFYAGASGAPPNAPIRVNRDPLMDQIQLPPPVAADIEAFLGALVDPRVAAQQFPFDRPALFTDRPALRPTIQNGGVPGSGGVLPRMIIQSPPMLGSTEFRVGLDAALGGAVARLGVSTSPPVAGRITPSRFVAALVTSGSGAGQGLATAHLMLSTRDYAEGQVVFMQWFINDPGASGGQAISNILRVPIFCGSYGCPDSPCNAADIATTDGIPMPDGKIDNGDFLLFISEFFGGDCQPGLTPCSPADIAQTDGSPGGDASVNNGDFILFITDFFAGC